MDWGYNLAAQHLHGKCKVLSSIPGIKKIETLNLLYHKIFKTLKVRDVGKDFLNITQFYNE